ncbi:hypothetical protein HDU76_012578 [Blyttiomyces sp. JEL0837]|nr:hypothetical protein HDU76_012578 [Blyttiomyces sp. JEL0837]
MTPEEQEDYNDFGPSYRRCPVDRDLSEVSPFPYITPHFMRYYVEYYKLGSNVRNLTEKSTAQHGDRAVPKPVQTGGKDDNAVHREQIFLASDKILKFSTIINDSKNTHPMTKDYGIQCLPDIISTLPSASSVLTATFLTYILLSLAIVFSITDSRRYFNGMYQSSF